MHAKPSTSVSRIVDRTIFTVVLNWNLPEETADCVRSLLAAGGEHVIVVDNGSVDDSVARLRAEFGERIELIANGENLGFAGGNNVGIQHALDRGAAWVLLANNDTIVAPDFFAQLTEAMQQRLDWGLFAPLILYYDEPERVWSIGDRRLLGTLITRGLWRNQLVPADLPPLLPVDFLTACGLVVRRDVFERIGLLDERYFMYAEDADFCERARAAGFGLGCATLAHMCHKVSRSTGPQHPTARYWRIGNQIRFYRQHAGTLQQPLLLGFTLLRSLAMSLRALATGRWALAIKTAQAWIDGWFRVGRVDAQRGIK